MGVAPDGRSPPGTSPNRSKAARARALADAGGGRGPRVEGRWKSPPARGGTAALSRDEGIGNSMAYRDLKEFVKVLRERGELKEIQAEVDPCLEITEITDRVVKRQGPALLFTNVKGHRWPVLINAFGTMERMALALGAESIDALAAEIAELLEPRIPASLVGKLQMLPRLKVLADMATRTVTSAPCQEVVITENPSLDLLPIIQCWPLDGGPYITLPW